MRRFWREFLQCRQLGRELGLAIPKQIRKSAGDPNDDYLSTAIREDLESYFRLTSSLLSTIAGVAAVALLGIILLLSTHEWTTFLNALFVFVLGALVVVTFVVVQPGLAMTQPLRKLPNDVYQELLWPLWRGVEFADVAISIGLFIYIFASWDFSNTLPIFVIVALLWIAVPWVAYLIKQDSVFIKLRLWQLGILIVVAIASAASPVPVWEYQWVAQRALANKMRPVDEREITDDWATLQWFTPEGRPNVWYSHTSERGYHLFSTPGIDVEINQKLEPVKDVETKNEIVAALSSVAQAQFVNSTPPAHGADAHSIALIVTGTDDQGNQTIGADVAKHLSSAGIATDASIFTPAFASSPEFRDLLTGKRPSNSSFHAEKFAGRILAIKVSVGTPSKKILEGTEMTGVEVTWTAELISASTGHIERKWTVKGEGVGFDTADAASRASARAQQQFEDEASSLRP